MKKHHLVFWIWIAIVEFMLLAPVIAVVFIYILS